MLLKNKVYNTTLEMHHEMSLGLLTWHRLHVELLRHQLESSLEPVSALSLTESLRGGTKSRLQVRQNTTYPLQLDDYFHYDNNSINDDYCKAIDGL